MVTNNDQQVSGVVVSRLNDVWRRIQEFHPDVPDVFIVTKATGRGRGGTTLGHYHAGQWDVDMTTTPEVMLSGECLHSGADQILQTLIHESVHAVAKVRGVQDTSRQGRYHNRRFVEIANEFGLVWPADDETGVARAPDGRIGFSSVQLPDETRAKYRHQLKRLACIQIGRPLSGQAGQDPGNDPDDPTKPKTPTPRVKVACGCREAMFGPKAWLELTPLICGLCNEQFVEKV